MHRTANEYTSTVFPILHPVLRQPYSGLAKLPLLLALLLPAAATQASSRARSGPDRTGSIVSRHGSTSFLPRISLS
jgi:hypothetical protein